jgi:5-methylcytosine-specific restriction protein A
MPTDTVKLLKSNFVSYTEIRKRILREEAIDHQFFPDELSDVDNFEYIEGATKRVSVNKYERNRAAREKCIKNYIRDNGLDRVRCSVCSFDFEENFGQIGVGYIHVHHKLPLSKLHREYRVQPSDLIPVCPNCHAMLHQGSETLSDDELRKIIRETRDAG